MTTRILPILEWYKLIPIFKEQGGKLPDPSVAVIAVAEEGDDIIGLWVLEYVLHAGPVWVAPEHRENGVAKQLNECLEAQLTKPSGSGYYMYPDTDSAKALAESLGLTKTSWEVWKREF